jgi:tetratricopeptide (TPR) repeat protein
VLLLSALALLPALGCASRLAPSGGEALRLSELDGGGDATRRASLRLCVEGLDAEIAGRSRSAPVYYERAIQLDPTNPYAYLVLARHQLEMGDPEEALGYLDRAQQLLDSEQARSPGVDAHLAGLRGAALDAVGRDGAEHSSYARLTAPSVWGDGRLSAAELR